MSKTSFDETKALELYHDHKTDTEIAKGVGALTVTIRGWRKRRGLPNISPSARQTVNRSSGITVVYQSGVDYRTALDPAQAIEMGRFLGTLLWAADKSKEAGIKPNVDIFMRAWIGLPISAEGKRQQLRNQQADYRRRVAAR